MAEKEGGTPWEVESKAPSHQSTGPYRNNERPRTQLWEYQVTMVHRPDDFGSPPGESLESRLDSHMLEMSKQEWELVSAVPGETPNHYTGFFRLFWKRLI